MVDEPGQGGQGDSAPVGVSSSGAPPAPAAPTSQAGAGTSPPAPAQQTTPWDGIKNEDTRNWVVAKGFPDIEHLAQSAFHLEKMTGDMNSLIRLPKDQSPENMRPIWEKLGAGATPDDYQLPIPEGQDDTFARQASQWMHEAGVPVGMARQLAEKWNEYVGGITTQQQTQIQEREAAQVQQLKDEWGKSYDANLEMINGAAEKFGMTPEQFSHLRQVMGPAAAAKFMLNIASRIGSEDEFVGGAAANAFAGSPEYAKSRIETLKRDSDFQRRWRSGDASAQAEWNKLFRIAYPS